MGQRPVLIVVAGPNGSGKTALTQLIRQHAWFEGCAFVNPDEIAQEQFGDWNSPDAVFKAVKHAEQIRERCLKFDESLAFETVLSTQEKISFIERAIAKGFFVRVFFIGTDSPQINASRIALRVDKGGHDVPIAKVISRYHRAMANLMPAITLANRAYIYDNSIENVQPSLQFRTVNGFVQKVYESGHVWADSVLEQLRRLD